VDGTGKDQNAGERRDRIREAEERFRVLTDHSIDPISEVTRDLRFVFVSPSFTKTFGYRPDELVGAHVLDLVHPDDRERIEQAHDHARIDEALGPLTLRFPHKDGSWRWVELTGCPYRTSSGEVRAILINRDVTERVLARNELRLQLEAERRIARLSRDFLTAGTENFEAGIERGLRAASVLAGADRVKLFVSDLEPESGGRIYSWSASGVSSMQPGYSREVLASFSWSRTKLLNGETIAVPRVMDMPEEARPERDGLVSEGVKSYLGLPIRLGERTVGCLDFFCEHAWRQWSTQEITRLGLLADVFASALRRHRAEKSRRQSEHRLQTLAANARDALCEVSMGGEILYASSSLADICGYSPAELRERNAFDLIHPEDRDSNRLEHVSALRAGANSGTSTFRMLHSDGRWRWLEATARVFPAAPDEERIAVVIRDVTSRQMARFELERQLLLERKLARVSRDLLDLGTNDIDSGIRRALASIADLARADRCWLVSVAAEGDAEPRHFEWCADDVAPRSSPLGVMNRGYRWVFAQLARGNVVQIPRTSDLPDEAIDVRDGMTSSGIRSFLAVPIRSGDSLIGALGFHSLRCERSWSDHEISLFRLVAGMFTSTLRRKAAEASLLESEARFRALAEHAKDPICEVDELGGFLYASPSLTDLLGYSREEIRRLNLFSLIHPDDFSDMRRRYGSRKLTHEPPGTLVYRARHKNGEWIVLEGTARVYHGAADETRIVAILRDVTERQKAQRTLERQLDLETRIAGLSRRFLAIGTDEIDQTIRESLADLAALAESDRSWLVSFDSQTGDIHDVFEWNGENVPSQTNDLVADNPLSFTWTAGRIFRGQVVHVKEPSELPGEAENERADLRRRGVRSFLGIPLHSGNRPVGFLGFETLRHTKSWSAESITLLRLVGEIFVTALRRKLIESNLRDSQQQLMQAQKMEAVGTLAGGIAHDFNNQLTVMLGNARYVLRQVEDDPDLKDALTDLNRAAEHCAQLTRSLLAFSRRDAASPQPLNVNDVVAEVQELLRPLIPTSIDFEVTTRDDVELVEADPTQLQQVLVNLALNARDAMPEGGSLVITTNNRLVEADVGARLGLPRAGTHVEIAVIDTGIGIDEESKSRIFEPFFTTKDLGKGTGLGLATAYGIVTESEGAIEVDTAVGSGTTFRVLLPCVSEAAPLSVEVPRPSLPVRPGTILVVEDESAVKRFLVRTFERRGYETLSAADGADALRLLEGHSGDIDAVITDIDMPRMNGISLARALAASHPGVPILFISGSSRDIVGIPGSDASPTSFLQKPFTEEAILDEVASLVAAAHST